MVISTEERKCTICGATELYDTLFSCPKYGYEELDFRPSPPFGDALGLLIEKCPNCGYVARTIQYLPYTRGYITRMLESDTYRRCEGKQFHSRTAEAYYQKLILAKKREKKVELLRMLQNVIWSCDNDKQDAGNAEELRNDAVFIISQILEDDTERESLARPRQEELKLIQVDYLRRNHRFEEATVTAMEYGPNVCYTAKVILAYQMELIHQKDVDRHNVGEIMDHHPQVGIISLDSLWLESDIE